MTAVRGIVQKQSTFETKVIHFLVHLMFPASSKFMKLKFSIFRGVLVIQKNNLFDDTIGSPCVQTFLLSNFRPQNFIWVQRFWQLDFWPNLCVSMNCQQRNIADYLYSVNDEIPFISPFLKNSQKPQSHWGYHHNHHDHYFTIFIVFRLDWKQQFISLQMKQIGLEERAIYQWKK